MRGNINSPALILSFPELQELTIALCLSSFTHGDLKAGLALELCIAEWDIAFKKHGMQYLSHSPEQLPSFIEIPNPCNVG
jgi:hypothetical protein